MANLGLYKDRSPGIRAAGLASVMNPDNCGAKECLMKNDKSEEAEYHIRALCRRLQPKPYGKRTPRIPNGNIDYLFGHNHRKEGPFAELKEKYRENSFIRKPVLGQAMHTFSKPDSVTNLSRTFGQATDLSDGTLYSIILPPKTAEQVNREYGDFHNKYIISHNHYFPAEQINRRYSKHFSRFDTFGIPYSTDLSGGKMKGCLNEGEEHLMIIKNPQKFVDDRTKGPLGKKFNWYPWQIPENMAHGVVLPRDVDMRSLLENTSPCTWTNKLASAISHLNHLRSFIAQRQEDINIIELIAALAQKDTEGTGLLPLAEIMQALHKMNIPANSVKIRTALSHYQLFVDEDCCEERVKYEALCNLLIMRKPLPLLGSITPYPATVYNKNTTYRDLCADRTKKPDEGLVYRHLHKTPLQKDIENTRIKDVIEPNSATVRGLWPSDFQKLRAKDEMERIFKGFVSEADFELIWQRLFGEHKDLKEMASITQFRAEMIRFGDEQAETKEKFS